MCAAVARLLVLAALPALAGRWYVEGEVVSVTEGAVRGARGVVRGARGAGGAGGAGVTFAPHQRTGVVRAVGQAATLDCRVLRLGDKSVSWVRSSDLQILSHAGVVFTADPRVAATAAREPGAPTASRHSLRIERLRLADAGRYECQVNTEPKMSLFFNLTVLDSPLPRVVVSALGPRVVSAAPGGVATLACEARYEPPAEELALPTLSIDWWRNGQHLDLESRSGGVSLSIERERARAAAHLTLSRLRERDAGEYWCSARGDPAGEGEQDAGDGGDARAVLHLRVTQDPQALEGAHGEVMQRDETVAAAVAGGAGRGCGAPALCVLAALAALTGPRSRA